MKHYKLLLFVFAFIVFGQQETQAQTTYTWKAVATNSSFSNSSNWTPSGIPGNTDSIVIVSSNFTPTLTSIDTVGSITMNSGSLDLGGFSLFIDRVSNMNGGTVSNGVFIQDGTSATFAGTTFSGNCTVSVISNNLNFTAGTFGGNSTFEKNGSANQNISGNVTFNGTTLIRVSGAGYLRFNGGITANGNITYEVSRTATNWLLTEFNTVSTYNGSVTLSNKSVNTSVRIAYGANANINGNLFVQSDSTGSIFTGETSGTVQLASGRTISVGGLGFSFGTLNLRNFYQLGTTPQALTLTNTATLTINANTTWNGAVTFAAPRVFLSNATFNGTTSITKTGANSDNSTGNCTFNGRTTITNNGTGQFGISNTSGNTFNATALFNNTSTSALLAVNNGTSYFADSILVQNTASGGIYLGNGGGWNQASGKSIFTYGSGFTAGTLFINNYTQTGSAPINLTFGSGATVSFASDDTINGPVTISAGSIFFNTSQFNGDVNFTKTGTAGNTSTGGTTFNGITSLTVSNSGGWSLSGSTANTFNGKVTFTVTSSGTLNPSSGGTASYYNDSVIVQSTGTGTIYFGSGAGTSVFTTSKGITIGPLGYHTGGLSFDDCSMTTPFNLNFSMGSSATLTFGVGNVWNGSVTGTAGNVSLNGSTFNGAVSLTKTGSTSNTSNGGNTYNSTVSLTKTGSSNWVFTNLTADTYNGNVTLRCLSMGNFSIVNNGLNTAFNGNILLEVSSGQLYFGAGSGTSSLAATKSILPTGTGYTGGQLSMRAFSYNSTNPLSIDFGTAGNIFLNTSCTFSGTVNLRAAIVTVNGNTFSRSFTAEKNGASNITWNGGSVFNDSVTIINSSTANLTISNTTPNTYNGKTFFTATSSGTLYFAYNNSTNIFSDDVTITNTGTSPVIMGIATGRTRILSGKTIKIGTGGFSGGSLTLNSISYESTSTPLNLTLSGTATLNFANNDTVLSTATLIAPSLNIAGTYFSKQVYLEKNGTAGNTATGGNTFMDSTTICNSSSGAFTLAGTNPDIFNGSVFYRQTGSGLLTTNGNGVGTQYNGNLYFGSNNGSIQVGNTVGSASLASGKGLYISSFGFSSGTLSFFNFTKNGTVATNFTTSGSATVRFGSGCTWNGAMMIVSPQIQTDGGTFNGRVTLDRTTGANINWFGGYTFNDSLTIVNRSASSLGTSQFASSVYNGNVFVRNYGTGTINLSTGVSGFTETYNGNIEVGSTSGAISIGAGSSTSVSIASGKTIQIGALTMNNANLSIRFTTINGTSAFSISQSGSGTTTLTSSTFGGNVSVTSSSISASSTIFNGKTTFSKTSSVSVANGGGNTFNDSVFLNNSGTGAWYFANSAGDNFNAPLTVSNSSSGTIFFNNIGTATTNFNQNIILNSTGSGSINFNPNGGILNLSTGKSISIGSGGFSSGTLAIRGVTQIGTTPQTITLTGSAVLSVNLGSTFNGAVNFTAPNIIVNGNTFNAKATFTKTGIGINNTWNGGTIFNDSAIIINNSNGALTLANTTGDVFNGPARFYAQGTGTVTTNVNGNTAFNNNLVLESLNAIIQTATGTGTATLATGRTIVIGSNGFVGGTLSLRNFVQNGSTAQNFTLGTSSTLTFSTGTTFNGKLTASSPSVNLNGSRFQDTTNITKTGSTANTSNGGNTFNGIVTLTNNSAGSWALTNSANDDFFQNATFVRSSTGTFTISNGDTSTFYKNLNITGSTGSISTGVAAASRVIFTGTTNASISGPGGAVTLTLARVSMSKTLSSGITLNIPVRVSTDLTMNTGFFTTTSSNILTLSNGATANIGNSTSFIRGPLDYEMAATATRALNFPIGKTNRYKAVTINVTHNAATSYTYRAELIDTSAKKLGYTLPSGVNKVSDIRYWVVNRFITGGAASNANLTNANITLYVDTANDDITDTTNLVIVKNTSASPTVWTNAGKARFSYSPSANITTGNFTTFSTFTLGNLTGGTNTLPVTFTKWEAVKQGENALLTWETAEEVNNHGFEVEHSMNGIDFESVGFVAATSTPTITNQYQFTHQAAGFGTHYYRLKQVDNDGKYTYTSIKSVKFDGKGISGVKISDGKLNFNASTNANESISVRVLDANGRLVKTLTLKGGNQQVNLEMNDLASGIYFIHIQAGQELFTQKVMYSQP